MIIKLLSKRQSSNEKEQFNAKNLPSIHDYKNLMFFTLYVARIMPIYWECFWHIKMFFVSIEHIFFYYTYLIIIIPHTYSLGIVFEIKNQFDANFTTYLSFIFKYHLQFLVYLYTN